MENQQKHSKITWFEINIGSGTTESTVEFNPTMEWQQLILSHFLQIHKKQHHSKDLN